MTAEELQDQIEQLIKTIKELEKQLGDSDLPKLPDSPSIEEVEKHISLMQSFMPNNRKIEESLFSTNISLGKIKPSLIITVSEEVTDRREGRDIANIFENIGYRTLVKESDFYLEDDLTENEDDYDVDVELTVNIGKEVLTASYILTLVFKGLVVGIFTKVGHDIYKVIKEKFLNSKEFKPIVVELLVKRRSYKNLRIFVYLTNLEECEKIPEALKFAEEHLQEFYDERAQRVMIISKDNQWKPIIANEGTDEQ